MSLGCPGYAWCAILVAITIHHANGRGTIMPLEQTTKTFDDLAELLDLQGKIAQFVRALRDLNARDPAIAKMIVSQLATIVGLNVGGSSTTGGRARDEPSVFERVARVFVNNGNQPLSKPDLAAAAGVGEGSLHTVIYNGKPDAFVREPAPKGTRGVVIRLTDEALVQMTEQTP